MRESLLKEGNHSELVGNTFKIQNTVELSSQDDGPTLFSGPVKRVQCDSQELLMGCEKPDGLVARKWKRLLDLNSKFPNIDGSQRSI